ncbi:tumor necrosis factor receptor superfamily member 10A-like isoform X1 [Corapipo altera]|uniref:tumor necrosis factor receptor superfamily member 10A-like isoform X1 n=1 Tax=Corapipo altera TaxID=415028 RepID=UPI000FD6469D|nr:tumor necrosis factor receptor superfamily member 10A-like isoform X1 [Corapipo altera]XP_027524730.1 tumor necrosis factor receptor superfamily member 10A-like isoform X1 [Corapipo altera]XP_027524731.1 tumor necrosis factor receptor superfamily member 10A-like isoform X1 [Corapipo altera]
MFCTPRRLCLFLLLLLARAAFGTDAAALSRRDDLDPSDPSGEGTYLYHVPEKGLRCQPCPAGTHLAKSCEEENGSSTCLPCKAEEFMDYPNAFHSCHECLKCREDQVELSPCQATKNTECACKEGTFCDPKLPCEMCHKCQTRCPEGQVVLSPCTAYSDLQCGPAQGTGFNYLWIIIPVVILILLVLGLLICKYCCCSPGKGRNLTSYSLKDASNLMQKLSWCGKGNVGTQDNNLNEQRSWDPPLPRAEESEEMLPIAPSPRPRPRRDLVPQTGKEPILALRSTFYIFAGMKFIYWKKFGRSLNMLENDLPFDRSQDAFYEMLNKWLEREGSKASVNTLLETLDQLDLRGVADDISSEIIKKGLFKSEGAEEQGGSCGSIP